MDLRSRYHRENIRKKTLHDFEPHLLLALARQFRFERSHPLCQVVILFLVEHMLDLMVSGRVSLRCQLIRGTSEVKQSLVEFVRREPSRPPALRRALPTLQRFPPKRPVLALPIHPHRCSLEA